MPADFFPASEGTALRLRIWSPTVRLARVLIVHGFGENGLRYEPFALRLTAAGVEVVTFDLRGHGESPGARGDLNAPSLLEADVSAFLENQITAECPCFIWGHSAGGQILLNALEPHPVQVAGLILTSTWFRLALQPPAWKQFAARWLLRLAPGYTLSTGLTGDLLSRDLAYLKSLPGNDLSHHRISSRIYDYLQGGGARALLHASKCTLPLLIAHGGADPVTDYQGSITFSEQAASTDKTLHLFPSARHELQNDLCRDEWFDLLLAWLLVHCTKKDGQTLQPARLQN